MDILNDDIREYIERSVLCWLATSSLDYEPNVSPKEVFMAYGANSIIIANIASPQSVKNIKENKKVSISFIDILVQKGYQLKGDALIISKSDEGFEDMKTSLEQITQGNYPFATITKIDITKSKKIIAPSYMLYPDRTEEMRVKNAKRVYGLL